MAMLVVPFESAPRGRRSRAPLAVRVQGRRSPTSSTGLVLTRASNRAPVKTRRRWLVTCLTVTPKLTPNRTGARDIWRVPLWGPGQTQGLG